MSEDPIIAIRQVVESIDEGCVPGSGHVMSGWMRRASKDEILDWVWGNLRGRVINALKRTEEAFEKKRNCDRFNSGDPEKATNRLIKLRNYLNREFPDVEKRKMNAAMRAYKGRLRNCDVGTAEEQTKRFSDFCAAHRRTDLPRCAGCPLENTPSDTGCSFAWAQMPYDAEKGDAKK